MFKGIQGSQSSTNTQLSKNDLRTWVKSVMEMKYPNEKFDEKAFERRFARMDVNKDGMLGVSHIKKVVMKKVKQDDLYVGKAH